MSKLKNHAQLKNNITIEKYLIVVKNVFQRTAFTKLRLSNHALMIEKGRHLSLKRFDRTCPFCPWSIETEQHVLLNCLSYSHLRQKILDEVKKNINFSLRDDEQSLFTSLLSKPSISVILARFIRFSMELRSFLLLHARTTR